MSPTSENNKRIARNTLMLYARMFVIMGVTLYTSRVVLRALGVTDYGIYNVVGGFIVMFAIISNSLSAAIGRFITFELGRGDAERLRRIFATAVLIQLAIGCIVVILAESVGLWFLNSRMNIPPERMTAAHWVYQLSVLTFTVKLISVPYDACIRAHERMAAFAYISIFEAAGNLTVALTITLLPVDRLAGYAVLVGAVALMVRGIYGWYCKAHFEECRFRLTFDKALTKEIFGFAGWNFIGASSGVLRDQGVNVLLNIFCGPAMNAARGIAMQVNTAVTSFSTNFVAAVNPQITKSYAAGNREYTMRLVFQGARLSFYLLLLVSLPVLVEAPALLQLWLGEVPEHTVAFVRLAIVYAMSEAISTTMITLMLATGRIRNYQLIVGGCQMLNFPVAYLLLKAGLPAETTMAGAIVIAFGCLFLRLYMLRGMTGLSVRRFLREVAGNIFAVCFVAGLAATAISHALPECALRTVISCAACLAVTGAVVFAIGCSPTEKRLVTEKLSGLKEKMLTGTKKETNKKR